MRQNGTSAAKRVTTMGLLFALAIVLSFFESAIMTLFPMLPPGVKLGLSNVVTMYCLFLVGKGSAFTLVVLKSLFAMLRGFISGAMSFAGGAVSLLVMLFLMVLTRHKARYLALSIAGAVAHNAGQIVMARVILKNRYVYYYFPILLLSGLVVGSVTGMVLNVLMPYLSRLPTGSREAAKSMKMEGNNVSKLFRKRLSGVAVPHRKNTKDCATVMMPIPDRVVIPMVQHMGAPCEPLVKVGDIVKVGQKIGDSEQYVSAPIHASVSGKVTGLVEIITPAGAKTTAVEIEADKTQEPDASICPPQINSREDFLKAVRASGLVGLGGAGFPTHVKLNPKNLSEVDTLVINGAECEPYITSDYRTMMEDTEDVLSGVRLVLKWLGIKQACIGIEDNKPDAIAKFAKAVEKDSNIQVVTLKSKYPQGAEKVIIYETTRRVVKEGMLPSDVGAIVMNITSCAFLAKYMKTGMPLISKRITVDGGAVAEPKNLVAPIGTPFNHIIDFCGGYKTEPKKLLMGGPMMGIAVYDDSYPLLKNNNAILAFDQKQVENIFDTPCIRCGKCVAACPFDLMPVAIERSYKNNDVDGLKALKVNLCMECGCCSYVCPAKRNLVLTNRMAKALLRKNSK